MHLTGYDPQFLGAEAVVPWPSFKDAFRSDFATTETGEYILNYHNYSVIVNRTRRFPYLSASNINGRELKLDEIKRDELFNGRDRWILDNRIPRENQWGSALYNAHKSDFDKGHMTKRQDVQWGSIETAKTAAESTFYYTNAVPQHRKVNRSIWRSIEDYILRKETELNELKISVFTAPVLTEDDPIFVTTVQGQEVKLPVEFYKVIYYLSKDGILSRVAFMVGQKYLLEKEGIIERRYKETTARDYFINFKQADTYQVNVETIEKIAGFAFPEARDTYSDDRPLHLVRKQTEVRRGIENKDPDFLNEIPGLKL